jgi:uncharacterized repeat protein (TIGR01451 family)
VAESDVGGLEYTFTRTGDTSQALLVNFSVGGTAHTQDYTVAGGDGFDSATGTGFFSIGTGQSTGVIKLNPVNDTLVEGTEHAIVTVAPGSAYAPSGSPADGTITDNDTATVAFLALTSNAPEETTPHLVGVKLTTFSPEGTASLQDPFTVYVKDITVPGVGVATGGGVDYTFNSQNVTFDAMDAGSTKTVAVAIVNDTVPEGNETFQLGLAATSSIVAPGPSPMPVVTIDSAPHTVTIVDNDIIDLALSKTPDHASITPGQVIKYTLNYDNRGLVTANGVKIEDVIPANTTFDFADSSAGWQDAMGNALADGAVANTAIMYPLGAVNAGGSNAGIVLAVKVNDHVLSGSAAIDNTATISDDGSGFDDRPFNNTAVATSVTLDAVPDLKLTQAADKLLVLRGDVLLTTYSYSNDGLEGTDSAVIFAHLPTGATFDAAHSTGGTWLPGSGGDYALKLPPVAAGGSGSVIFAVTVNTTRVAGLHQVDTEATIGDDGSNGIDPTPANNLTNNSANPTKIYEGIYAVSQGIAVAGKFGTPTVHVYDPIDGHQLFQFDAYESKYRNSIRVAVADINGDGFDDIITTTGKGTGRLRVFNGLNGIWLHDESSYTGAFKNEIAVFSGKGFEQGAFVAAGDLTGDGRAEIVVGSALGGGKVRVFDGLTGQARSFGGSDTFFQPFGKAFRGGVRVAVGDVLGDNSADLVTGMGLYGSEVKVYDGDALNGPRPTFTLGPLVTSLPSAPVAALDFKIGAKTYRGGVSVALGDLDGNGKLDLIVGRNWGRPTLVETFSGLLKDTLGNPQAIGSAINPFDPNPLRPLYALGVRVGAIDIDFDGVADIIAATGGNNKSTVNIYSGATHELLRTFTALPQTPNSALFTAGTAVAPVYRPVTA